MGQHTTYKCTNCSYSTLIAGRRDVTMTAVTDTFICRNCKELVDIVVGEFGQLSPIEIDKKNPGYTCPNCGSGSHLKKWKPHKRPCPKCGTGKMEIDENGSVVMTD